MLHILDGGKVDESSAIQLANYIISGAIHVARSFIDTASSSILEVLLMYAVTAIKKSLHKNKVQC